MTHVDRIIEEKLRLRFLGSLVEQIGAQMYPSATASVAELISNAYDADATNVWVTVPFGEAWAPEAEIVVIDDGLGMTRAEAQAAYLLVGRKRREVEGTPNSPSGRPLHGRKGIGKLAAFGTAKILELATRRAGQETRFRLDYDHIRRLPPTGDYEVENSQDAHPLVNPETQQPLEHGTRIRLTSLLLRRPLPQDRFVRSMSRRFAIDADVMRVEINGVPLTKFDALVQFRFPDAAVPSGVEIVDGWFREIIDQDDPATVVRWWMGFTPSPIDEEGVAGVSVVAHKKMVQRPFMFERSQGTEGQLGEKYLVGEVEADWLDTGLGIEDDLIQANRDQLQLEDERLSRFLRWGRQRLEWALRQRNRLRIEEAVVAVEEDPEIRALLEKYTATERKAFLEIRDSLTSIPEVTPADARDLLEQVVVGFEDRSVRELMERIGQEDPPFRAHFWNLVREFGLIDARKNLSIIEARVGTIERLRSAVHGGALEVERGTGGTDPFPSLHSIVKDNPWLLDPRWHLLDEEVEISRIPELAAIYAAGNDAGLILDFLFVLAPRPPAAADQIVVVEIKRGTDRHGNERRVSADELNKFAQYVTAIQTYYGRVTDRPQVRGVMIAQQYAEAARGLRALLEQAKDPILEFKTWDRVIDDTYRMHLGWLDVSRKRVALGLPAEPAAETTVVGPISVRAATARRARARRGTAAEPTETMAADDGLVSHEEGAEPEHHPGDRTP